MAFHPIRNMDLWEIIRRWHDRQSISHIAQSLGYDRKTVRGCQRLALSLGLSLDLPLPPKEEVLSLLESVGRRFGRIPNAQAALLPFLQEIVSLINDPHLPLKPKTAFEVLCDRHDLTGKVSYTSYKRFIRTHKLAIHPHLGTCRIEVEPGSEAQIDYGRVGRLFDPESGHIRVLHAFIGTLSHSRMKYVELTFRPDQVSFVGSHIRMFEFFQGVPKNLIIDNLKAGVIKPDLYDPKVNRSYAELIQHYDTFVDPARVARPKDKGKVERDVQTVREAVRKLIVQNPSVSLAELNRLMKDWSVHIYGEKEHGTTCEKPAVVFCERERPRLKPLPLTPFEITLWKQATVHPDHYIQFGGKAYSMPHAYVGKKLWIRATERILQAFFDDKLIKQHLITKKHRHTDFDDFPENVRAALDTSYIHKKLLDTASRIGPTFHRLIEDLLSAHAFINLRRCMGLVDIAKDCPDPSLVERASRILEDHRMNPVPLNFRHLLARLSVEASTPTVPPLSQDTAEFVRDITYFINTTERPSP